MSVWLSITFEVESCYLCGIPFGLTAARQKHLIDTKETFYCPSGHQQHYNGKTHEQELADLKWQIQQKDNNLAAERAEKERLIKRVKRGVCLHCKRHFPNIAAHMRCKHPDKK